MAKSKDKTSPRTSVFGRLFGAVIAVVLLSIYEFSMAILVSAVLACGTDTSCRPPIQPTSGLVFVLTTVGGLVSALVVAELAVMTPGVNPFAQFSAPEAPRWARRWIYAIVILYLAAWLFTGLTALIVGVVLYPNVNSTLSDAGTTWLGLAVAAGYAYFGIRPRQSGE
jgi:hypothetical protein